MESWLTITPRTGSGDGEFTITTSLDDDLDREGVITVTGSGVNGAQIKVYQEGLREIYEGSDEEFLLSDGDTFNVLKPRKYATSDGVSYVTSDNKYYRIYE